MIFESKTISLKNGGSALLRAPEERDGKAVLDYLVTACGETEFLVRYPEEWTGTAEDEGKFLASTRENPNALMILCEVDGVIAGNCDIAFHTGMKTKHRAVIGIALMEKYWGLGIGTALLTELIKAAENRGVRQVELDFVEGNSRARALYEKMGFRIVSVIPDAFRLKDGSFRAEYHMIKYM
ncbi:MAG: GNAT family N-acetyltransferase [Clostridia bacterium]|nr:GNAT family N-acetyltransferase [Clostridia bacterium]